MHSKVLVFDIWGDFGHFRKIYTTTSPLTYSFPPRVTIIGIISAILGKKRDSYYETFDTKECDIGIRIMSPVKKGRFNTNLINTKLSPFRIKNISGARTQINFEVLKNPKYRIYFRHKNPDISAKLIDCLKNNLSFYTVTLGLANCLANFKFIAESKVQETALTGVDSVVPMDKVNQVLEYGENFKVRLPVDFDKNRVATYKEYIFERNGKQMKLDTNGYIVKDTQEKIIFL